ncbi:hypothetical protein HGRIS_014604 [Hohenbuehelia grisea]|uniref:Uncharacterized protein n=1 Tax=Hohenbuehelia grisea TaxID=104357 RepID=A0ABR3JUY0_9AGAR
MIFTNANPSANVFDIKGGLFMQPKPEKKARNCCFCIPIRPGAGLLSACIFLASLLFMIVDIVIACKYVPSTASMTKAALSLHATVSAIVCLSSLIGLISVFKRSKKLAVSHLWASIGLIPFSIVFGSILLSVVFSAKDKDFTVLCYAVDDPTAENPYCHENVTVMRDVLAALTVLVWFLQLGGVLVNRSYASTLTNRHHMRYESSVSYY